MLVYLIYIVSPLGVFIHESGHILGALLMKAESEAVGMLKKEDFH